MATVCKEIFQNATNWSILISEKIGIDRDQYWGFVELTDSQFDKIIRVGKIDQYFDAEQMF